MKLWDKIRELLFGKNIETLPESTSEIQPKISFEKIDMQKKVKQTEKERFHDTVKANNPIQYNTIEHAIDQYLKALYFLYNQQSKVDSYKALTCLEGYKERQK